ncbi:MAG: DNA-deoxyinosine glycosylase [Holdemanella sp.]|nr:DNA-deoxyinosine glycosylase [Holdemanella sp.]
MCKRIVGLNPIVFEDSRILVLDSMPSVMSLKEQMYYANKTNRFWKILEEIYQESDKIELLKVSHIALWDICHSCIRKMSADSEIKDIEPNDIPKLLNTYKNIEKVICNGRTSYNTMKKYFPDIETVYCPSTSSANARFSLEQLIEIYKKEFCR